jgi:hypothetical protein
MDEHISLAQIRLIIHPHQDILKQNETSAVRKWNCQKSSLRGATKFAASKGIR